LLVSVLVFGLKYNQKSKNIPEATSANNNNEAIQNSSTVNDSEVKVDRDALLKKLKRTNCLNEEIKYIKNLEEDLKKVEDLQREYEKYIKTKTDHAPKKKIIYNLYQSIRNLNVEGFDEIQNFDGDKEYRLDHCIKNGKYQYEIQKNGFEGHTTISSVKYPKSLIDILNKCGKSDTYKKFYETIKNKLESSLNSTISSQKFFDKKFLTSKDIIEILRSLE
jgi:hypothetical protein